MTRMTNDIESLNEMFAQGAITLIADFVKMVAIVVVMLTIDSELTAADVPRRCRCSSSSSSTRGG